MGASPMLRIGIDASRAFGPLPTGTEHYATALIRALVAEGRHHYRLYFRSAPLDPPPGAEIRLLPAPRLWTHSRLAWEIRRRPPDLLFVPAHVLPLGPLPPAVVTVHDLGFRVFPQAHTRRQRWYLNWSTRRHVRRADRILADSAATRDDLLRFYDAEPARVKVVHLAVDEDFRPAPDAARAAIRDRLAIPPERRYLLHVGTRQPRKNLPRLLEAFAALAGPRPELDLVLAGMAGWGREDLAEQARRLGIAGRLRMPGYLPRSDLPALYSGAAAFVLPSLYEGFGLPLLEAMACGTPAACGAGSSLPEVAGGAAVLFDPLDPRAIAAALAEILDRPERAAALAEAGRARAASFSWARTARETRRVLEAAAGR